MTQTKIIYGFHAVKAAIRNHPEHILTLYCLKNENNRFKEWDLNEKSNLPWEILKKKTLDDLTGTTKHQGIAAKIRMSAKKDKAIFDWLQETTKPVLLLLLEGIQDPHNLGACLRSAEALGVNWVVLSKAHSAPINTTVSKVSCGADQSLPIVEVSNLVRFIEQIKSHGLWVIGTSSEAKMDLARADLTRSIALVMGTEGKGLKRLTLAACDEIVKIPLLGQIESLNVSVATGICLYECLRQRKDD